MLMMMRLLIFNSEDIFAIYTFVKRYFTYDIDLLQVDCHCMQKGPKKRVLINSMGFGKKELENHL